MTGQRKGVPPPSSPEARKRMQANRSRDTGPEKLIRSLLHAQGLRFRVDYPVPGGLRRRADIAFRRARVAVFVDGCFWHGCPIHGTWPKQNAEFWRRKIEHNQARDRETDRLLEQAGWRSVRIWEHERPQEAVSRVRAILAERLAKITDVRNDG